MSNFTKLFYKLTSWYPRLIPSTKDEWDELKVILKEVFQIEDDDTVWYAIYSRAQQKNSSKSMSIRRSLRDLSNTAKRLKIDKLAQDEKILAAQRLQAEAEKKIKELAEKEGNEPKQPEPIIPQWSDVSVGTSNPQPDVQRLSQP